MEYTVIICTYNRSALLKKAIDSLINQTFDKRQFNVIVVDNNSTDDTVEVVKSYDQSSLEINYVFEHRQGIAFARNRGAAEVKTEYFLYLDDDAVAASDWLEAFDTFNLQTGKKFDCVAGHVSLIWEGDCKPSWYPRQWESLLSGYDLGPDVFEMTKQNYLLTVNVALKTKGFFSLNGFREDLGRVGSCLLSGEDVDLFYRLLQAGYQATYLPTMRVRHLVEKARQRHSWLRRRLFWDGATQPLIDYGVPPHILKPIWRHLIYDLKMLLYFLLNAPWSRDHYWTIFQRTGRIVSEARLIARSLNLAKS